MILKCLIFQKKKKNLFIKLDEMDINIFVPIINIDENRLKCCYDTLNINLGKICPIYYSGKFKINIISFVNQDLMMKIEDYKSEEINEENNENREEKDKKDDDEEEEENKEKKKEINQLNNIQFGEEINKNLDPQLISVLEQVKKEEKAIQIFIEIPSILEEKSMKLSCKLIIKTLDGKECSINICIKFRLLFLLVKKNKF